MNNHKYESLTNAGKEGEDMNCNRINVNVNRRRERNTRSSSSRRTSSSERSSDSRRTSSSRSSDFDEFEENELVEHLREFVGRTVTIFTTSGGASGSGFTGVVIRVNDSFVTLLTQVGTVSETVLDDEASTDSTNDTKVNENCHHHGVETDIPIDRIAAFEHNVV